MSTVLVLGVGPLPVDSGKKIHAPGIRVWHLAQYLVKHHHNVVLGIIEFGDFRDNETAEIRSRQESLGDRLSVCRLKYHSVRTPEALATLHAHCRFDCVVSTTDIMNSVAASIPVHIPLWLDYLGDPLSERQLQAATYDNDSSLLELWQVMAHALLQGDRFSVASTPQKYALIGQLGLVGRLNQFTAGHDLITVLPNCSRIMREQNLKIQRPLKGTIVPASSFILLWAGGYNTWTDPETLFRGLELVFQQNPSVYFVSVGREIPGHDNVTFHRFRGLCENSQYANHFQFIGWVSPQEIPSFYAQADAAINVDAACYEAEIGTRTRIIDWISYEIPVVTTALCEPTLLLQKEQLIFPFEPGDPKSLAEAVLWVASHREEARQRAVRARAFLDQLYDEEVVFAPLDEWVRAPAFAPDRTAPHWLMKGPEAPRTPDCTVANFQRKFLQSCASRPIDAPSNSRYAGGFLRKLLNRFRRG